ncbi:MAG: hypothetical protein Q9225_003046 [Loekoesia sp. 1 TL-2023]
MDNPEVEQQPPNLNTLLLRKLSAAVNGHAATATFACGGSVPIIDESAGLVVDPGKLAVCLPVKIRCDTPLVHNHASITFPYHHSKARFDEELQALLRKSGRATFGIGGRDVLDEGYRKANKLDASQFSSNFHPHDCGILDSIQQVLLPSTVRGGLELGGGPQSIKAELYKLNVRYCCGGTLRVKHRGQTIDFDWAHVRVDSIEWAAFYGDCEHEVLEVSEGHRVTLTYNLYYSWTGDPNNRVHLTRQLPLYSIVHDMLKEPTFLQKGGLLGFFCHHQYAHAHGSGRKSLPHAFKGVDLAVYSVFHSLRLKVGIHPIIKNKSENMGGMSKQELMEGTYGEREGDHVELFLEDLDKLPNEDYEYDGPDEEEYRTIVGTRLHGPTFDPDEDEFNEYGNQAELNYQFSAAAIIVVVPPSSGRLSPPTTGDSLSVGGPPLEAYTGQTLDTLRPLADSPGGDTATFGSVSDTQGARTTPVDLT